MPLSARLAAAYRLIHVRVDVPWRVLRAVDGCSEPLQPVPTNGYLLSAPTIAHTRTSLNPSFQSGHWPPKISKKDPSRDDLAANAEFQMRASSSVRRRSPALSADAAGN